MGANCVTGAKKGLGAATRPSSSTTRHSSTKPSPSPPYCSGMVSAGQSRAVICFHSAPAAGSYSPSLASKTCRTSVGGQAWRRTARTLSRNSSCSSVGWKSMAEVGGSVPRHERFAHPAGLHLPGLLLRHGPEGAGPVGDHGTAGGVEVAASGGGHERAGGGHAVGRDAD